MSGSGGNGGGKKRALILAGGGLKVAFQAGVLQVWLDEAGLRFDLADGASGGVFNLAMWCQGFTGTQMADAWRGYRPLRGASPNWAELPKLYWARSLLSFNRFRKNVLRRDWGIDWDRIRATDRVATFNAYNFTRHELAVIEPRDMTEDHLIAAVSLPMWFPPVRIGGEDFIDAVYTTDANLDAALARGADELWIIWTVSDTRPWRNGFVANYFQIIESAANGPLKLTLDRIALSNRRFAAGQPSEFNRHVEVKMLKAEVPLHYLFTVSNRRFREAVDLGVAAGRRWCEEQGLLGGGGRAGSGSRVVEAAGQG